MYVMVYKGSKMITPVSGASNAYSNTKNTSSSGSTGDTSTDVTVATDSTDTRLKTISAYGADTYSYLARTRSVDYMSAAEGMFDTNWVTSSPYTAHSETDVFQRLSEEKAAENQELSDINNALNSTSTQDTYQTDDGLNSIIYDSGLTRASESASISYEKASAFSSNSINSLSLMSIQA